MKQRYRHKKLLCFFFFKILNLPIRFIRKKGLRREDGTYQEFQLIGPNWFFSLLIKINFD